MWYQGWDPGKKKILDKNKENMNKLWTSVNNNVTKQVH